MEIIREKVDIQQMALFRDVDLILNKVLPPGGLRAISSGKAYVVIDNTSNKSAVEIVGEYFHNYLGINISVDIGKDLGISISPSDKSKSMGSDYIRMN